MVKIYLTERRGGRERLSQPSQDVEEGGAPFSRESE